jgi:acrylyl-CoA reductase (NADPH)
MREDAFRALVLRQGDDKKTAAEIEELTENDLPSGDVLIDVEYSGLNYKDAMAVTGAGPIVRKWPMVPGIDLAGTIIQSEADEYQCGDQVVLTGWGVGEKYWGGYSERQRVSSEWLVPLPAGLSTRAAMGIGTAGLTAMLCVLRLESAGLKPDAGKVLVSGASGGVGSVAVAILKHLGYEVAALTTSREETTHRYLKELGASEIVPVVDAAEKIKPLDAQKWVAAIDTVGSTVLARILTQIEYGGAVAACGLAAGVDLPSTVMPFILRNVSLLGVDSVMCPKTQRINAWQRLADDLPTESLEAITREGKLENVCALAAEMMSGRSEGRAVINLA